ncbi:hypothetical protein Tco_1259686 [Tanacetum coccineum]
MAVTVDMMTPMKPSNTNNNKDTIFCSPSEEEEGKKGLKEYYTRHISHLQLLRRKKANDLARLQAQRNLLNDKVDELFGADVCGLTCRRDNLWV